MKNCHDNKSKKRVYICHTYYHAYVAVVKELGLGKDRFGEADIILSTLSNDFGTLNVRLETSGIFGGVWFYDEKDENASEEVKAQHVDRSNIVANTLQRIRYTKLLGRLQEDYIPVDLKAYEDVYVFCDSDPIGYYLNYKKIYYHAIEDGLNSGLLDDQAYLANKKAFKFKLFLSKLGLIFIESGYGRYCIDYEVNDIKANHSVPPNAIEVPRRPMTEKLSDEDHKMLVDIFLENADDLRAKLTLRPQDKPFAMILTEPLCAMDIRRDMFADIINMYKDTNRIIIKPHPRDMLDYEKEFTECIVIRDKFPMEVLNDLKGFKVEKIISVITQVDNVRFADEIVYLGLDFLDKYEAPEIHRRLDTLL